MTEAIKDFFAKVIAATIGAAFFAAMASSILWFPYLLGWITFKMGYDPFGMCIFETGLVFVLIITVFSIPFIISICAITGHLDDL